MVRMSFDENRFRFGFGAGLALAWFAVQQVQSYINAYKVALIEERKISAQVVPTLMVAIANREIGYGSEVTEGGCALYQMAGNVPTCWCIYRRGWHAL